jgi:hypothetical protein
MRQRLLGALLLVAASLSGAAAGASFAPEPLKTTVASSDLIVLGTLGAVRARPAPGGAIQQEGTITVEEHLAGDAVTDRRCTLTWWTGRVPGGADYRAQVGRRGIWLLHQVRPGLYEAGYPARFQPVAKRSAIEKLIRSPLFLVDTAGWSDGGKACCIRLMIRTFLPRLEVTDYVSLEGGTLRLHGRAQVEVQGQIGDLIATLRGKLVRVKGPAIVVTRDRPHVVEVDLRRFFAIAGRKGGEGRRGAPKGKPGREVFHLHWGTGPDDRSPSYVFELN